MQEMEMEWIATTSVRFQIHAMIELLSLRYEDREDEWAIGGEMLFDVGLEFVFHLL